MVRHHVRTLIAAVTVVMTLAACDSDGPTIPSIQHVRFQIANETGESWKDFITQGQYSNVTSFRYYMRFSNGFGIMLGSLGNADTTGQVGDFEGFAFDSVATTCSFNYMYYQGSVYTNGSYSDTSTVPLPFTMQGDLGNHYTLVIRAWDDMELVSEPCTCE